MADFAEAPLTAAEARVLGVLVEKQYATPDAYPLTANSLVAGCNQKTSRFPIMNLSESEIVSVLENLKYRTLVIESYGASGRVLRYAHNLAKVLGVGQPMLALLAVLMLRGPLTAGELRTMTDRLYRFPDISSVEAYLEDMITRAAVPLVVKLSRQPGSREQRWAHLLAGPVADLPVAGDAMERDGDSNAGALGAEVAALRDEVRDLRARLERLEQALGDA